jgi:hypothetical protein
VDRYQRKNYRHPMSEQCEDEVKIKRKYKRVKIDWLNERINDEEYTDEQIQEGQQ